MLAGAPGLVAEPGTEKDVDTHGGTIIENMFSSYSLTECVFFFAYKDLHTGMTGQTAPTRTRYEVAACCILEPIQSTFGFSHCHLCAHHLGRVDEPTQ